MRSIFLLGVVMFLSAPMAEGQSENARRDAQKRVAFLKDSVKAGSKKGVIAKAHAAVPAPAQQPANGEAGIERGMTDAEMRAAQTDTADPDLKERVLVKPSRVSFDDTSSGGSTSSSKKKEETPIVAVTPPAAKPVAVKASNTGKPFTRRIKHKPLVEATRICDRKVYIYVTCADLLAEANRVVGKKFGVRFATLGQYANFLARAEEAACPIGETAYLSRVLGGRVRANDNYRRKFRPGERCLYVDNLLVLSLDCSNPAKSDHYLRASTVPEPKPETAPKPLPPAPRVDLTPALDPVYEEPPEQPLMVVKERKGFPWGKVALGLGAIAVGTYIYCEQQDGSCFGSEVHIENNPTIKLLRLPNLLR